MQQFGDQCLLSSANNGFDISGQSYMITIQDFNKASDQLTSRMDISREELQSTKGSWDIAVLQQFLSE